MKGDSTTTASVPRLLRLGVSCVGIKQHRLTVSDWAVAQRDGCGRANAHGVKCSKPKRGVRQV
jgi:hypothetical protein